MPTILESLKGINAYPVPLRTLESIAARRGVYPGDTATQDVLKGAAYNLCRADVLMWLSLAPDISQGGQSFSFTDEQRTALRRQAQALYDEYGVDDDTPKTLFGYKGSRL